MSASPRKPRSTVVASGDRAENFRQLVISIGELFDELFVAKPPVAAMFTHLLKKLYDGRLEAIGIMTKPDLGCAPQAIPSFIFDKPKISFARNSVENFGRKFEGVRIRRLSPNQLPTTKPSPTKSNKPGRRTKGHVAEKAIQILSRRGSDLNMLPRKQAYQEILVVAKDELGANIAVGFSVSVLNRALIKVLGERS